MRDPLRRAFADMGAAASRADTISDDDAVRYRLCTGRWPVAVSHPARVLPLWYMLQHESRDWRHHRLGAELTPLLPRAVCAHMGGWTPVGSELTAPQSAWLHAWCAMKRGAGHGSGQGSFKYPRRGSAHGDRDPASVDAAAQAGVAARMTDCADMVRGAANDRGEFVVGIVHGTNAAAHTLVAAGLRLTVEDAQQVFAFASDTAGMWDLVYPLDSVTPCGVVVMSIGRTVNPTRSTWIFERALAAAAWYRLAGQWLASRQAPAADDPPDAFEAGQILAAQDALNAAIRLIGGAVDYDNASRVRRAIVDVAIKMNDVGTHARVAEIDVTREMDEPVRSPLPTDAVYRSGPFGVDRVPIDDFDLSAATADAAMAGLMAHAKAAALAADQASDIHIFAANAVRRAVEMVERANAPAARAIAWVAKTAPRFMSDATFMTAASMDDMLPIDLVELIRVLTVEHAPARLIEVAWARLAPHLATDPAAMTDNVAWDELLTALQGAAAKDPAGVARLLELAIKPYDGQATASMRVRIDAAIDGDKVAMHWWRAHDRLAHDGQGASLYPRLVKLRDALGLTAANQRLAVQRAWQSIVGDREMELAMVMAATPTNAFAPKVTKFVTEYVLPAAPWARWVWRALRDGVTNHTVPLKEVERRLSSIGHSVTHQELGEYARRVERPVRWLWIAAMLTPNRDPADRVILYAVAHRTRVMYAASAADVDLFPRESVRALLGNVTAKRTDAAARAARELVYLGTLGVWSDRTRDDEWAMFSQVISRAVRQGFEKVERASLRAGRARQDVRTVERAFLRDLAASPNRWTFLIALLQAGATIDDGRAASRPFGHIYWQSVVALGPDGAAAWITSRPWSSHLTRRVDWRDSSLARSILDTPIHMATWRKMADAVVAVDDAWMAQHGETASPEVLSSYVSPLPRVSLDEWLASATSRADARAIVAAFMATISPDEIAPDLKEDALADAVRFKKFETDVRAISNDLGAGPGGAPFFVERAGQLLRTSALRWFDDDAALASIAWFVRRNVPVGSGIMRLTESDVMSLVMKPKAVDIFTWRAPNQTLADDVDHMMHPDASKPAMSAADIILGLAPDTPMALNGVLLIAEAVVTNPGGALSKFVDWDDFEGVVPARVPSIWLQAREGENSFAERLVTIGASMYDEYADDGDPLHPLLLPPPAHATPTHVPLVAAPGTPWEIPRRQGPPWEQRRIPRNELDAMQRGFRHAAVHGPSAHFTTRDPVAGAAIVVAVAMRRFAANEDAEVVAGFGERAWWWRPDVPMRLAIDPVRMLGVIWDIDPPRGTVVDALLQDLQNFVAEDPLKNFRASIAMHTEIMAMPESVARNAIMEDMRRDRSAIARLLAPSPVALRERALEAVTVWVFGTLVWVPTGNYDRAELQNSINIVSQSSAAAANAVSRWLVSSATAAE